MIGQQFQFIVVELEIIQRREAIDFIGQLFDPIEPLVSPRLSTVIRSERSIMAMIPSGLPIVGASSEQVALHLLGEVGTFMALVFDHHQSEGFFVFGLGVLKNGQDVVSFTRCFHASV